MISGSRKLLVVACLCLVSTASLAQGMGGKNDVFKGKLFPPNIILEHQDELDLTREQFTSIRRIVVEIQGSIAEHEWDLRQAYVSVLDQLDALPVDEEAILENVQAALLAENEIKKLQARMLIRLRNQLTGEQIEYLRQRAKK